MASVSENTVEQTERRTKRKKPDCDCSMAINELSSEFRDFKNSISEWRRDMEMSMNKISENVVSMKNELASLTHVTSEIKNDISSLRSEQVLMRQRVSELDAKYKGMAEHIDSVKDSVNFVTGEHTDLSKKVDNLGKHFQETVDLKPLVVELVAKIDNLEQNARNCNIEICNVPERRNENLPSLMQNIGSALKCNVQQGEIISIHRVPHAHQQSNRPKNIVVKLASRILRDNLLSAHRLGKGLATDQLGISGSSLPIYMHEHLTLKNKHLFRECREAAKRHNYKFLWVKHGTILIREKEGARAFAIRTLQDIAKIKPGFSAPIDNKGAAGVA